jgi:hypothetical protein
MTVEENGDHLLWNAVTGEHMTANETFCPLESVYAIANESERARLKKFRLENRLQVMLSKIRLPMYIHTQVLILLSRKSVDKSPSDNYLLYVCSICYHLLCFRQGDQIGRIFAYWAIVYFE